MWVRPHRGHTPEPERVLILRSYMCVYESVCVCVCVCVIPIYFHSWAKLESG